MGIQSPAATRGRLGSTTRLATSDRSRRSSRGSCACAEARASFLACADLVTPHVAWPCRQRLERTGKDWKGHKIIRVTSCHVRVDSWIEVDGGQRYDRIHKRIREDPGYNWSILKVAIQVAGEIDGFVHLRVQVETNAASAAVPLACHAVPLPTLRHPWVTQTTGRTARVTI